jgi:predicted RNA-binding protein with PUA-like domain
MRNFWLMKSEPDEVSIDDALSAPKKTISWFGVRNYQARNFMRDAMQVGDEVLFYHSSCALPGIAGLAKITSSAYPDATQFDRRSPYFDAASKKEEPRWMAIDVKAVKAIDVITLPELRAHPQLSGMRVLARGNRLSITPVTEAEFEFIRTHLVRRRPARSAA